MTSLAFAFGGHVLMPDIQSEMAHPREFTKAVMLSQLFLVANYALVGFVSD